MSGVRAQRMGSWAAAQETKRHVATAAARTERKLGMMAVPVKGVASGLGVTARPGGQGWERERPAGGTARIYYTLLYLSKCDREMQKRSAVRTTKGGFL